MSTELAFTREPFGRLHCHSDRSGRTMMAAQLERFPRADHWRIAAQAPERDVRVHQEHPCETSGTS